MHFLQKYRTLADFSVLARVHSNNSHYMWYLHLPYSAIRYRTCHNSHYTWLLYLPYSVICRRTCHNSHYTWYLYLPYSVICCRTCHNSHYTWLLYLPYSVIRCRTCHNSHYTWLLYLPYSAICATGNRTATINVSPTNPFNWIGHSANKIVIANQNKTLQISKWMATCLLNIVFKYLNAWFIF
jgi:hypothetical protein